jgi:hypothetical protein
MFSLMVKYIGNHCFSDDTEIEHEGSEDIVKEIENSMADHLRWSQKEDKVFNDGQNKLIKQILSEEKEGKKIVEISLSYHDDLFNKILRDCDKSKEISILRSNEG